jgi:hypothetical protein
MKIHDFRSCEKSSKNTTFGLVKFDLVIISKYIHYNHFQIIVKGVVVIQKNHCNNELKVQTH